MVEAACPKKSGWATSRTPAHQGRGSPSARAARTVAPTASAATGALASRAAVRPRAAGAA